MTLPEFLARYTPDLVGRLYDMVRNQHRSGPELIWIMDQHKKEIEALLAGAYEALTKPPPAPPTATPKAKPIPRAPGL